MLSDVSIKAMQKVDWESIGPRYFIKIYLQHNPMDKPSRKAPLDKDQDPLYFNRTDNKIKFNLRKDSLQCFISAKTSKSISKAALPEKTKLKPPKPQSEKINGQTIQSSTIKVDPAFSASLDLFNNKLLVMEYGTDELYIDSTRTKSQNKSRSNSPKQIREEGEDGEDDFVASCIRVITQETDNTSNPVSARCSVHQAYHYYPLQAYYTPQKERVRNRRSVTQEESLMFQIDIGNIERDGRTTLMLRNIPNKYTRDMILQEIDSFNLKKKYDFFYLPIDYKNQCNVGYAFINFIHTKFIGQFYQHFHLKRWQKFNSQKICQVCYARIQGTAQLMNHFKDSTVIQQKDKRLRPMIDMNYSNLAEIVQRQKNEREKIESSIQQSEEIFK